MTSVASARPPVHHLESQPDNLLVFSDVANDSYVPPRVLSEVMDQEKAKLPSQLDDTVKISHGTKEDTEVPPLQPESKPVKDNKAVPW